MKINFTTVKEFLAILLFVKSIVACSSDDLLLGAISTPSTKSNTVNPTFPEIYTDSTKNGAIILDSEPLGNPYNIDTLKKAYAILYPTSRGRSTTPEFKPTHYQIRFLPVDSIEFSKLMTSGIVFTTIPLDKQIAEEGTYYFDPQLEAQGAKYTWQYAILPVTEELPNVRHEVVAEICAPNDGLRGRSVDGLSDIWPALELKAHEMCGQEIPSKIQSRVGLPGMQEATGKYIYVWDDKAYQYIPAKGAYVVAFGNSWSSSATTDERGSYDNLKISGPITRMAIQWQDASSRWIVYDGASENDVGKQAIYACSSLKPKFTYLIKGGKQQTFAVVTRVLHRFYYEFNHYLPVPVVGISVICLDAYSKDYAGLYSPGNVIRIWGKTANDSDNNVLTQRIFATTAHELGHLLHYKNIISTTKNWNSTEDIIIESWARCVQWLATEYEYNGLGYILGRNEPFSFIEREPLPYWGISGPPGQPSTKVYNKPTEYNYQDWPFQDKALPSTDVNKGLLAYSPLFVDLFDRDNQADYYRAYGIKDNWSKDVYTRYPNDQVSDYATAYVISALRSAKTLNQLKENIKNARYNSEADKIKIDTLFNRYIYYWNKYR